MRALARAARDRARRPGHARARRRRGERVRPGLECLDPRGESPVTGAAPTPVPPPAPVSAELEALRKRTEELLRRAAPRYALVADRFEVPYQATRIIVHPLQ